MVADFLEEIDGPVESHVDICGVFFLFSEYCIYYPSSLFFCQLEVIGMKTVVGGTSTGLEATGRWR